MRVSKENWKFIFSLSFFFFFFKIYRHNNVHHNLFVFIITLEKTFILVFYFSFFKYTYKHVCHIMNIYIYTHILFSSNFYTKHLTLLVTCFKRTPKTNNIFWTSAYVINHLFTYDFQHITLYGFMIYYINPSVYTSRLKRQLFFISLIFYREEERSIES